MSARILDRLPTNLPPSLASLTAPCYLHKANQAAVSALLSVFLALALAGIYHIGSRWISGKSDAGEVAMAIALFGFLLILLRPSVWRAPITHAADSRGVYFVGGSSAYFVPWQEIGPIAIESANTGSGPAIMVVLAIHADSSFWTAAKQSRFMRIALPSERPPGYLPVPLGTQGIAPETTLECLEALRALSGGDVDRQAFIPRPGWRRWELVVAGVIFLILSLYFIATMLYSFFQYGSSIGTGLAIAVAVAIAALWMVCHGWRRKC